MRRPAFTFKQYVTEVVLGNWGYNPILNEELTDREKSEVDSWGRGNYSFSDHAFGGDEKQMRTIIPVGEKAPHPDVVEHLAQHGYKVHDYEKGIAKDANGREMKIGKVLAKTKAPNEIFDAFENDPNRSELGRKAAKFPSEDLQVVISRHPHDIGAMTTDRGWPSCMDMRGGCNQHYLARDVHEGTHVAFLTKKGDDTAEKPLARIALKPFYGDQTGRKILHPESKVYARPDSGYDNRFTDAVNQWTEQHFPKGDSEIFKKSEKVYDDDKQRETGTLEAMLNHPDEDVRASAYRRYSHKITPEHIEKTLARTDNGIDRGIALAHPKASTEVLDREWDKIKDPYDKKFILQNRNAPKRVFEEGMKLGDTARRTIAENPSAPKEILHELLHSSNPYVGETAANNPSTTRESRLSAIADPNVPSETKAALVHHDQYNSVDRVFKAKHLENLMKDVVEEPYNHHAAARIMDHVNATPKMFDMILESPNRQAASDVIRSNPDKISKDGWHKAINHDDYGIAADAIENTPYAEHHKEIVSSGRGWDYLKKNRHVTSNTLDELLSSDDPDTRAFAVRHKNHTEEHVEQALADPDPIVRTWAAQSPKATSKQLDKALSDPDRRVRFGVGMNPYAGNDRKKILANDPDPDVASLFDRYKNG